MRRVIVSTLARLSSVSSAAGGLGEVDEEEGIVDEGGDNSDELDEVTWRERKKSDLMYELA